MFIISYAFWKKFFVEMWFFMVDFEMFMTIYFPQNKLPKEEKGLGSVAIESTEV